MCAGAVCAPFHPAQLNDNRNFSTAIFPAFQDVNFSKKSDSKGITISFYKQIQSRTHHVQKQLRIWHKLQFCIERDMYHLLVFQQRPSHFLLFAQAVSHPKIRERSSCCSSPAMVQNAMLAGTDLPHPTSYPVRLGDSKTMNVANASEGAVLSRSYRRSLRVGRKRLLGFKFHSVLKRSTHKMQMVQKPEPLHRTNAEKARAL